MRINNNRYSSLNNNSIVWLPFFLGLMIVVTIVLYLNFPSGYNQGIYHYQGLVLKNGGLPYTDFVEKKGPMGLLTYSLAAIVFGETVTAYRIFDLLILGIITFFLFRLVRLSYSKPIGWLVCVIWLNHTLVDGPGNTADVTNIITACYVALGYHLLSPKKKNYYIVAGIIIALACWVKPTALLIAMPLIFLFFDKDKTFVFNQGVVLKLLLGMGIPTVIFVLYLVISGTFYGFWESVVLDTIFNYSGNVSRFSSRMILKTGGTFLKDPVLRIGGILSLFLFSKNSVIKFIVIGIGLMLFVEGRLYPYQFSILWPFLTIGVVEGILVISRSFSEQKQQIILALFCVVMTFPTFKIGSDFIKAGFLTHNFDAGQTFIFSDFKDMYNHRKSVVSYLKGELNPKDELLVLGQDPNIYLELGVITTCRFARDGRMLTGDSIEDTPSYLINWQEELLNYMNDEKADWIVLLKTLPNNWMKAYKQRINSIFSEKYQLEHETEGHLIYKKRQS